MGVAYSFVVLFLLSSPAILAQTSPTRDQRWRDDLQTLNQFITQTHPSPYTNISRTDYVDSVSRLNDAIPQLSDFAVAAGMAKIVASIGDIHTSVFLTQ